MAGSGSAPQQQGLRLMDLHDAVLSLIVSKLGIERRTLMLGAPPAAFATPAPAACLPPVWSPLPPARRPTGCTPWHCPPARAVCKRLRELAEAAVHSRQLPGQSVMDAVELARPGDCLHLRPGFYKEALLLRKPLHLTCDGGEARILSPARFAVMVTARGALLERLVLKSHQVRRGGGGCCGCLAVAAAAPPRRVPCADSTSRAA